MKKIATFLQAVMVCGLLACTLPLAAQVYKTRDGHLLVFSQAVDLNSSVKMLNTKLRNETFAWPSSQSDFIKSYRNGELIFGSPVVMTDEALGAYYAKLKKEQTSAPVLYFHPAMLLALGQAAYIPGALAEESIQIERTGLDKKSNTMTLHVVDHQLTPTSKIEFEHVPSTSIDIVLKLKIANEHWIDSARVYKKVVGSKDSTLITPIVLTTASPDFTLIQVWDTVKVVGEFVYTIQPHDKFGLWHDPLPGIYAHNYTQETEPRFTAFTTKVNESKAVRLTWETSFPLRVRGFDIFRSARHEGPFIKIASVGANEKSYEDHVKGTMQEFFYYVQVIDQKGIGAKSITQFVIPTAKEKPAPPSAVLATPVLGGVDITWSTFDAFYNVHGYYVYRRAHEKADWVQLTSFLLRKGESMTYRDTSANLNPAIQYAYAIKSESTSYLHSDLSTPVYARPQKSRDIMSPQQVNYRMLDNGTVILFWQDMRKQDPYITKYHVYEVDMNGKVIAEVASSPVDADFTTWQQPITAKLAKGYAVLAEDSWGNKSSHSSSIHPQSRNNTVAPVILISKPTATGHVLRWGKPSATTVKSIEVYKMKPDGKVGQLVKSLKPDITSYSITDMKTGEVETFYITYKLVNGSESERSDVVIVSK